MATVAGLFSAPTRRKLVGVNSYTAGVADKSTIASAAIKAITIRIG
jgi:hypothetical protein